VVLGCVGGALPDVVRVIKSRELPASSGGFWLGLILQVALGGFVSWLAAATTAKEAVAYGFAAPEVITRLVSTTRQERGEFNLREWWVR